MNIYYYNDYITLSEKAAAHVIFEIEAKKDLLICAATGNSPEGLYQHLVDKKRKDQNFYDRVRVIKLDEWIGLPESHPASCEYYLKTKLLDPLEISSDRYISFQSNPPEATLECSRIQSELKKNGPIDVCILGLGSNGHIGLNEPGSFLEPYCHLVKLSETSQQHKMIQALNQKPTFGITLGIKDILDAEKIIL